MKKITTWECRRPGSDWEYNHFDDGWSERDAPRAINDYQAKSWAGKEWRRRHTYLHDDMRIADPAPGATA